VEELQTLVNRMEAGLNEYNQMGYNLATHSKLKKEIRKMEDITGMDEFSEPEDFLEFEDDPEPEDVFTDDDDPEPCYPGSEWVPCRGRFPINC
jgi:hypothetical protein